MAVLSREEILKHIERGEIKITPYVPEHLGCSSYDLTLGNEFRTFTSGPVTVTPVREDTDYTQFTEKIVLKEGEHFLLRPGATCLAITHEKVELSPSLCGLLEGRTRFARLGMFVHISAGFMQSGVRSAQVLEIFNASPCSLALYPGERVCQFVFLKMLGEAVYSGKFVNNVL